MNWLIEFFILIIVGVLGIFAIRIPLMIISPFHNDIIGNMYFHMTIEFVVFGVFLFQAGRVIRKNLSIPAKKSLSKNKNKIIFPLFVIMIFGILLPTGYIIDDIRYGSCSILSTDQTGSGGGSYNLLSSEQECKQDCVLSSNFRVSTDRTIQCNFDGLGYSWSENPDRYNMIDEDYGDSYEN